MATRFESSVTSISWIPSEAISGPSKIPFELGVTHYDETPPDHLEDLEALRMGDRFREANELRAYIEVEDGRVIGYGQQDDARGALHVISPCAPADCPPGGAGLPRPSSRM